MIKVSVATAALAFSHFPLSAFGLAEPEAGETLIRFIDRQPATPNRPMIQWDQLTQWMTPETNFFAVSHYGTAKVAADKWQLEISGLVKRPKTFALDEIKSRCRHEIIATLECSGNGSST